MREITTENYKFMSHTECEFFPCHKCAKEEEFNCLFCYCPLYALGDRCGGNFKYTDSGVKDCSDCMIPHSRKAYEYINSKFSMISELARRKDD